MAKKAKRGIAVQPPAKSSKAGGKGAWRLMDRGSTVAAGLLAQKVSSTAWRAATGRKPPTSTRHPDVSTGEAVAWAVVGGALVELVKVMIRRGTSNYWVKSTGHLPPGMKPLVTPPPTEKEPVPTEPAPKRTFKKKGASTKKVSRRNRGK